MIPPVRHATKLTGEKYCSAMLRKRHFQPLAIHGRRYRLLTSFAMQDNLPDGDLLALNHDLSFLQRKQPCTSRPLRSLRSSSGPLEGGESY